jgi:hypothetical protein
VRDGGTQKGHHQSGHLIGGTRKDYTPQGEPEKMIAAHVVMPYNTYVHT